MSKTQPLAAELDEKGHEVVDSTPMAPPIGYKKQPTMVDHIRNMVRSEQLRREAEEAGAETFAESDDFNIPDDPIDPSTPYEEVFEPPVPSPVVEEPAEPAAVPSSTTPTPTPAPTPEPPKA